MLGAIYGNNVGSVFEFDDMLDKESNFEELKNILIEKMHYYYRMIEREMKAVTSRLDPTLLKILNDFQNRFVR